MLINVYSKSRTCNNVKLDKIFEKPVSAYLLLNSSNVFIELEVSVKVCLKKLLFAIGKLSELDMSLEVTAYYMMSLKELEETPGLGKRRILLT